jgi:precorrin-2 dehydrogenase / sirohydrochlorin ferrochelatase
MAEPYCLSVILKSRPVVVIGGGAVAERKVEALLDTGAKITVIAPELTEHLRRLGKRKRLCIRQRWFSDEDLEEGWFLVFAATDSKALNLKVTQGARARGMLVNCADTPNQCDFFVPAQLRRGSLTIAVSTGGKAPGLAKRIHEELAVLYGEVFADYVELLSGARKTMKKEGALPFSERRTAMEKLMEGEVLELLKAGRGEEALHLVNSLAKAKNAGKMFSPGRCK